MIVEKMTSSADDAANVPRLYQNGIEGLKCLEEADAGRGCDDAAASFNDLGPAAESWARIKSGYELISRQD